MFFKFECQLGLWSIKVWKSTLCKTIYQSCAINFLPTVRHDMYDLWYIYFTAYLVCSCRWIKQFFFRFFSRIQFTIFNLYFILKFLMILIFKGWMRDVIFGGRNFKKIFLSLTFFGCIAQLSTGRKLYLELACNSLFHSHSQLEIIVKVIHELLFTWQWTGNLSMNKCLNHQSFKLSPTTTSFFLSLPDMFTQHKTVILSTVNF